MSGGNCANRSMGTRKKALFCVDFVLWFCRDLPATSRFCPMDITFNYWGLLSPFFYGGLMVARMGGRSPTTQKERAPDGL